MHNLQSPKKDVRPNRVGKRVRRGVVQAKVIDQANAELHGGIFPRRKQQCTKAKMKQNTNENIKRKHASSSV